MTVSPLPEVTGNGDNATVHLIDYLEAIRAGDIALQEERDRRYAEVSAEREKALKIKEQADDRALDLARQIQDYKDEKANELREQINKERVLYATRADVVSLREYFDALHKPVVEFVANQQGKGDQSNEQRLNINTVIQVLAVIIAAIVLYTALHH